MFSDPLKNLKTFGVKETDIVADFGAGTGFYSVLAADIAKNGKIYAVEISKDFIQAIRNKIEELKLNNIECIWGDVERPGGSKLADGIADKVIASTIFFQVEDKGGFLDEVRRVLKDNGEVLFIEWDSSSKIPRKDHVVPPDQAKRMFEKKGFIFERNIDAGVHHYGMIFKKGKI